MKKILSAIAFLFMLAGGAFATTGGFEGTSDAQYFITTEAKSLPDGSYVMLKGNILSKTGSEKYLFQDDEGTITVEIDDDKWNGLAVGSTDNIIIEGEVDRDFGTVIIEVDRIKLNK